MYIVTIYKLNKKSRLIFEEKAEWMIVVIWRIGKQENNVNILLKNNISKNTTIGNKFLAHK